MSILEYLVFVGALVFIEIGTPVTVTLLVACGLLIVLKLVKGERL